MSFEKSRLYSKEEQFISTIGKCIKHPARYRIIKALRREALSFSILSKGHPISPKTVFGHLAILQKIGIVNSSLMNRTALYGLAEDDFFIELILLFEKYENTFEMKCPNWQNRILPTTMLDERAYSEV